MPRRHDVSIFFFNDTATTEIYTLSLHDALPIFGDELRGRWVEQFVDRRHDAELEQRLDHLARLPPHLLGELAHRDGLGYPDELALHLGRRGWRRLDGGSRTGRRGRRRRGLGGARRRSEERRVGEGGRSRWSPYH